MRSVCRSCRYRKCLASGMSPDAIHPPHDAIGRRNSRASELASMDDTEGTSASSSSPEFLTDLAHVDVELKHKRAEMVRRHCRVPRQSESASAEDFCSTTEVELKTLVDWTSTLPLFNDLPADDRQVLLKRYAVQHLIFEQGCYTAESAVADGWHFSNGTYIPASMNSSKTPTKQDPSWRQDFLYWQSASKCLEQVAEPLRLLRLSPEERVAVKLLMLFNCGNHENPNPATRFVSNDSRRKIVQFRERVITALSHFYASMRQSGYEERLGNVVLLISGIVTVAPSVMESYQVMRLFQLVKFQEITEQLLFTPHRR